MNTKSSWVAIALVALASPLCFAQTNAPPVVTPPPSEITAAKPKAASAPTRQKRKSGKRYSKTTLSAFKPLNAKQTQVPPAATGSSATLSPVLLNAQPEQDPLRQPLPQADLSARTAPFTLTTEDQGLQAADAEGAVEPDPASSVVTEDGSATDPDGLGQQSSPATDRLNNKPKTRAIAKGPFRLRVKDKAVRASVQIPLESPKP